MLGKLQRFFNVNKETHWSNLLFQSFECRFNVLKANSGVDSTSKNCNVVRSVAKGNVISVHMKGFALWKIRMTSFATKLLCEQKILREGSLLHGNFFIVVDCQVVKDTPIISANLSSSFSGI